MIKLPTWKEFIEHNKFQENSGLCSNTYQIIVRNIPDNYKIEFHYFLKSQKLNVSYPIKIGGYLKSHKNTFKSHVLYHENNADYFLYVGMQGALRHNLYNRYIRWLVEKFPELFYL